MSDDQSEGIAKAGAAAALATIDPTGGVAFAMLDHIATNMGQNAKWRRQAHDLLVDALLEENDKRRQEYARAESEFDRHKKLIEWLQDELAAVRKDVEGLQAVAMHLIAESEELLRARPDPEMRPYLVAAFHNTIRFPDKFRPTWVRRLTALLRELGADHLEFLVERVEVAGVPSPDGGRTSHTGGGWLFGDPRGTLVFQDLLDSRLVERITGNSKAIVVTFVGVMLADFVTLSASLGIVKPSSSPSSA